MPRAATRKWFFQASNQASPSRWRGRISRDCAESAIAPVAPPLFLYLLPCVRNSICHHVYCNFLIFNQIHIEIWLFLLCIRIYPLNFPLNTYWNFIKLDRFIKLKKLLGIRMLFLFIVSLHWSSNHSESESECFITLKSQILILCELHFISCIKKN